MTSFETKYRPQSLNEVVFPNDEAQRQITNFAKGQSRDSLILHGEFGTGKTTIAELLPAEMWSNIEGGKIQGGIVKNLNASQTRGIDTIRNLDLLMCLSARHRFIILDEADGLTGEAFASLRGTMNKSKKIGGRWFIFTTNHLDNIDSGIQSRSLKVKMGQIPPERWLPRAKWILEKEGYPIVEEGLLLSVIENAGGDNRAILEALQDLVNMSKEMKDIKTVVYNY